MTRINGHSDSGGSDVLRKPPVDEFLNTVTGFVAPPSVSPKPATTAQQREKKKIQQNRIVIIAAGAVVASLIIFVVVSMPRRGEPRKTASHAVATNRGNSEDSDKSLFPIVDSGRPAAKEDRKGFLNERDLQRTVTQRAAAKISPEPQTNGTGTLGSIEPFGDQAWQAPPFHPGASADLSDSDKEEREAMQKSSLIYVRSPSLTASPHSLDRTVPDLELGLATGTRLRARLESAVSTAVRTPVMAVIEYNYQRDGEIVVPAGAIALGHIRGASRSGYVDVQFDSLLMPDGVTVAIEAVATGLDLGPLKGKVEGKNTGKNVLVRSLSGIGKAGAMLVGQGNLNQSLNESDLMRERLSNNIGEAGDEEVSRLAMNQHIVVTVSAGVPIYVVLEQAAKPNQAPAYSAGRSNSSSASASIEQLRQLLQLQQELNQPSTNASVQ